MWKIGESSIGVFLPKDASVEPANFPGSVASSSFNRILAGDSRTAALATVEALFERAAVLAKEGSEIDTASSALYQLETAQFLPAWLRGCVSTYSKSVRDAISASSAEPDMPRLAATLADIRSLMNALPHSEDYYDVLGYGTPYGSLAAGEGSSDLNAISWTETDYPWRISLGSYCRTICPTVENILSTTPTHTIGEVVNRALTGGLDPADPVPWIQRNPLTDAYAEDILDTALARFPVLGVEGTSSVSLSECLSGAGIRFYDQWMFRNLLLLSMGKTWIQFKNQPPVFLTTERTVEVSCSVSAGSILDWVNEDSEVPAQLAVKTDTGIEESATQGCRGGFSRTVTTVPEGVGVPVTAWLRWGDMLDEMLKDFDLYRSLGMFVTAEELQAMPDCDFLDAEGSYLGSSGKYSSHTFGEISGSPALYFALSNGRSPVFAREPANGWSFTETVRGATAEPNETTPLLRAGFPSRWAKNNGYVGTVKLCACCYKSAYDSPGYGAIFKDTLSSFGESGWDVGNIVSAICATLPSADLENIDTETTVNALDSAVAGEIDKLKEALASISDGNISGLVPSFPNDYRLVFHPDLDQETFEYGGTSYYAPCGMGRVEHSGSQVWDMSYDTRLLTDDEKYGMGVPLYGDAGLVFNPTVEEVHEVHGFHSVLAPTWLGSIEWNFKAMPCERVNS